MEGPRTAGHVYRHLQEDELTDSGAIKRYFLLLFLSFFYLTLLSPRVKKTKSLLDHLRLSRGGRQISSETNSLGLKSSESRSALLKLIQKDLQPEVPGLIQIARMMSAGRWCWPPADEQMSRCWFQCQIRTASCPTFLSIKSVSQPLALFPQALVQQSHLASVGHLWPKKKWNVLKMTAMILPGLGSWKAIWCRISHIREKSLSSQKGFAPFLISFYFGYLSYLNLCALFLCYFNFLRQPCCAAEWHVRKTAYQFMSPTVFLFYLYF